MKNPSVSSEAPERLSLPRRLSEQMIDQCQRDAPLEACGLLLGNGETVTEIREMNNSDAEAEHYMMEPEEQFEVFKELREREELVVGIYHSHPASEAHPSPEDVRLAFYPGIIYVIISLAGKEPVIRGFKIIEEKIEEVEIETV